MPRRLLNYKERMLVTRVPAALFAASVISELAEPKQEVIQRSETRTALRTNR